MNLLTIEVRLDRGANLHFFHGPALYAWLLDRLGNPAQFPAEVRLWSAECGRVTYAPGDSYRFGLALLERPGAMTWLQLLEALRRPPRTEFGRTQGAPFGSGTHIVAVRDAWTGMLVHPAAPPTSLEPTAVVRSATPLVGTSAVRVILASPLRILRTPVDSKDFVMDGQVFDAAAFLDRCSRAVAEHLGSGWPAVVWPSVKVSENAVIRADASYTRKRIAAAKGRLQLEFAQPLTVEHAQTLVMAGLLGIGQASNMGLGRFTVGDQDLSPFWPPAPMTTLAARATTAVNFERARQGLIRAGETPGVDDVGKDAFLDVLTWRQPQLVEQLATGAIEAQPLRGIVLQRADGKMRGLAVPTMQDRFLQRAVVEEIGPAVEQLLEDSSFAYRRGLSRRSAELAVRKAHDDGFRHVAEADIRSFFDEVDWQRLRVRLEAYFGTDPMVDALMAWVQAPVEYAQRQIVRSKGLPQGAVISPILANLYLDGFDEAMVERGYRLVRYADDFVLLCRRPEDATAALEATQQELQRLGLRMASEKSKVAGFEQGFRFLGYLFCKTMVLDVGGARKHLSSVKVNEAEWADALPELIDPAALPGWLAGAAVGQGEESEAPKFTGPLQPVSPQRKPVYVVSSDLFLTGTRRGLRLWRDRAVVGEVAWEQMSELAVLGGHRLATSVFQHALRERIPVTLYTRQGEPVGVVLPEGVRSPSERALQQHRWAAQPGAALAAARSLVEAKIHNLRLLARRQEGDCDQLIQRLEEAGQAALRADSTERLRGLEGRAAHDWFGAWPAWLPPEFRFEGRSGRGATDPINAVLNLLYTQLFRQCWQAALAAGLDPYLGLLHVPSRRYAALAADLQEPFRFLVDRLVLDLARRHRLQVSDFQYSEKATPNLRIGEPALKLILGEWEARLDGEVEVEAVRTTYRQHLRDQAGRLAQLIDGERADLRAFRLKW
jgi:group II intron reverse transcriptase/maturase/CRISPR-associated endonuclease Cas1